MSSFSWNSPGFQGSWILEESLAPQASPRIAQFRNVNIRTNKSNRGRSPSRCALSSTLIASRTGRWIGLRTCKCVALLGRRTSSYPERVQLGPGMALSGLELHVPPCATVYRVFADRPTVTKEAFFRSHYLVNPSLALLRGRVTMVSDSLAAWLASRVSAPSPAQEEKPWEQTGQPCGRF